MKKLSLGLFLATSLVFASTTFAQQDPWGGGGAWGSASTNYTCIVKQISGDAPIAAIAAQLGLQVGGQLKFAITKNIGNDLSSVLVMSATGTRVAPGRLTLDTDGTITLDYGVRLSPMDFNRTALRLLMAPVGNNPWASELGARLFLRQGRQVLSDLVCSVSAANPNDPWWNPGPVPPGSDPWGK